MKKILAFIALLMCFGTQSSLAADTTFVSGPIYTAGDCAPCSMTDSEYYLLTGSMAGSSTEVIPGSSITMTVIDQTTGTRVPAILAAPGPDLYPYGYLGMPQSIAMTEEQTVDVGGYKVVVNPNNRFRLIGHHFVPSRESATVPVDSARSRSPYGELPTSFATGLRER
jgi:hypothetical protein